MAVPLIEAGSPKACALTVLSLMCSPVLDKASSQSKLAPWTAPLHLHALPSEGDAE
jgi:hypothetical protein